MQMFADDTDDFYVVRRTTFWRLGVSNMLTDRIFVRKKPFREFLINDSDATSIFVFTFGLSEITSAQQFHPKRVKIAGRDRSVKSVDAWIGRFRVGRHRVFHANNSARVGEIGVGQHGARRGCDNSRQLSGAFCYRENQAAAFGRLLLDQTKIKLGDQITRRVEAGIKSGSFESAAEK